MITEATLPLRTGDGRDVGRFTVTCLRGREKWREHDALLDFQSAPTDVFPAAPVQLLEELSYAYSVASTGGRGVDRIEPVDLFTSTKDAGEGRLEAQRATGTLTITVCFTDGTKGQCDVEVRSRKLNYQTEYRSMLLRIAREAAELVQSAFAPSALPAFRPDSLHDPETTYQRFAFIKALLESEEVRDALHLLQRRPHFEHIIIQRTIDPARATKAGASLSKQMTAPGPRQQTLRAVAGLLTVPRTINEVSNETTYDTVPNRFVKYVLTRWRSIAVDVERALPGSSTSEQRGRREAQLVAEDLERALSSLALAEAGRLTAFPHSNQVLQGRAGYREILEAFLLAESAATIDWEDRDRLFRAGQRNVAELYEYWVFLELVRIVETLAGFKVDKRNLVRHTANRLSLELCRTGGAVVSATGVRRGTPVVIELWFNKSFPGSPQSQSDASWTVAMRPDCSIHVMPLNRALSADTWVHFDAKYRIHELSEALDEVADGQETPLPPGNQRPISSDLAKMHAYRDAIRRTAGAYVLYPGRDDVTAVRHSEYHEILPGLGAFTLRPTDDGESSKASSAALAAFLDDVIDHVAAQGTAAERALFWTRTSYDLALTRRIDHDARLTRPPRDTKVLLGFVKSPEHLAWVITTGLYNLRADTGRAGAVGVEAPELTPDFVLLYGEQSDDATLLRARGVVSVLSADELRSTGYPDPRGRRYFCLAVGDPQEMPSPAGVSARALAREGRIPEVWAAPRVIAWSDLAELTS